MRARASILATSVAIVAILTGAMVTRSPSPASATAPPWPLNRPLIGTGVEFKWLSGEPAPLGDTIAANVAFADPDGHAVGREGYACTLVATDPEGLLCHGTIQFAHGTVQFQGEFPRHAIETVGVPFSTTVIGGSGPYAHVTGDLRCVILQLNVGRCTFVAD